MPAPIRLTAPALLLASATAAAADVPTPKQIESAYAAAIADQARQTDNPLLRAAVSRFHVSKLHGCRQAQDTMLCLVQADAGMHADTRPVIVSLQADGTTSWRMSAPPGRRTPFPAPSAKALQTLLVQDVAQRRASGELSADAADEAAQLQVASVDPCKLETSQHQDPDTPYRRDTELRCTMHFRIGGGAPQETELSLMPDGAQWTLGTYSTTTP